MKLKFYKTVSILCLVVFTAITPASSAPGCAPGVSDGLRPRAALDRSKARQLLKAVAPKILKRFYGDNRPVGRHVLRVTRLALLEAERMGVPQDAQTLIVYAGLLHDIGYFKQPALGRWFELGNKYGYSRPIEELHSGSEAFCEKYESPVLEKLKSQYPGGTLISAIEDNIHLIVAAKIREAARRDGEDLAALEPVEESLEKAFRHAEYSAKMLKECPPGILAEAGIPGNIAPLILPIVMYHSHPNRMPVEIPNDTRLLTQILVAADSFESANNRERGRNYYNRERETLLEAFAWLDNKVNQKDVCRQAVEAMEDLLISRDQDALSIVLEAREAWELPPDDLVFIDALKTSKLGIDGRRYKMSTADQSNRADSEKRIEALRGKIKDRVDARRGKTVSGEEAVIEARWLLGRLIESSNCSDKLFKKNMPPHMAAMEELAKMLDPDASCELSIAAMLHDADRFFDGYYVMMKDEPAIAGEQYSKYYKPVQHPAMAAEFVAPLLRALKIDEGIISKVDIMIRNHETGALGESVPAALAEDCRLLMDADGISMFTPVLLSNILENQGFVRFRSAVSQKYSRSSRQARIVINQLIDDRKSEYERVSELGGSAWWVVINERRAILAREEFERQETRARAI